MRATGTGVFAAAVAYQRPALRSAFAARLLGSNPTAQAARIAQIAAIPPLSLALKVSLNHVHF